MGRSSGGFSGGSRGGSFGGSRGSGMRSSGGGRSFSGGSRSSGSFSGGRSSSTFSHSRPSGSSFGSYSSRPFSSGGTPRPVRPLVIIQNSGYGKTPYGTTPSGQNGKQNSGSFHPGYRGYTGGPRISVGCLYSFLLIVVILTFMAVVFGGLWAGLYGEQNENAHSDITYSTMKREPLPSNAVTVKNGYYTDELGWIESKSKLESGMKSFYEETGVMPYLYLTDTVDGETSPKKNDFINFANAAYDELFTASNGQTDEAHLLVIFHEYYDGDYTVYYVAGVQAQSVIDDEAGEILLDYFDRYYYDGSKNNTEFFAASFREAGKAIMKITRPVWYYPTILAAVLLIFLALISLVALRAKKKKEQAELDKQILNTPLQTFGDAETDAKVEELAKKYESDIYD